MTTAPKKWVSALDRMTVTVPEGEVDGLRVKRFEVGPHDLNNLREAPRTGRQTRPGTYTKLVDYKTNTFWMSDTDAEKWDHIIAVRAIEFEKAERVLINGLGLGMVLAAALTFDHVQHVDVVERDQRVIDLVGPHYTKDPRVNIIHADAWDQMKAWPKGTRWDVAWSDIWPKINADYAPEMDKMQKFYGRRTNWHRCWARPEVGYLVKQERAEQRRQEEWLS
jgi:hypothetical protein